MELFTPSIGLLIWTLSTILSIISAIVVLTTKFKNIGVQIAWLLAVLFVPFIGPVLFFIVGRKQNKVVR